MENHEDILAEFSINKVLLSILETVGEVKVSTLAFIEAGNSDKGLVVEYDEEGPSFIFKLGDKVEQQ